MAACIAVAVTNSAAAEDVVAETPGTSYTHSEPEGWQGNTRREGLRDDHDPDALITVRVYERPGGLRPFRGDRPIVGVDVTAEIETCPDGNDRIGALHIGGRRYAVDGQRSAARDMPTDDGRQDDETPPAETELRCDPATWRCRITGR